MLSRTDIAVTRHAIGPVGASLLGSFTTSTPVAIQRDAVGRLERAGYGAVWTNEVLGKDAFVQLGVLLAETERLVFGTCIANIWVRAPQTMHAAAAQLAEAYPGRFVAGLGVGYPEQAASVGREFGQPLATMRDYLQQMDSPTWPPAPEVGYPRIIAANGPKMLQLSSDFADGAMPAMLPVEFTVRARQLLGPDKLLVVGLSAIVDDDLSAAKAAAREQVSGRLGMPAYASRIADLGYSDDEIAGLADRVVDSVVAHGDSAAIAEKVQKHLNGGADHVTILPPMGIDFSACVDQLERLAPALAMLV